MKMKLLLKILLIVGTTLGLAFGSMILLLAGGTYYFGIVGFCVGGFVWVVGTVSTALYIARVEPEFLDF